MLWSKRVKKLQVEHRGNIQHIFLVSYMRGEEFCLRVSVLVGHYGTNIPYNKNLDGSCSFPMWHCIHQNWDLQGASVLCNMRMTQERLSQTNRIFCQGFRVSGLHSIEDAPIDHYKYIGYISFNGTMQRINLVDMGLHTLVGCGIPESHISAIN